MGVCSGHFPSQRRVQTTNPSGLGGTVLQEGDETYAPGEDVLPMGAQTLRSSHACYQHPPSRIRNAGTTTTSVDSYTGDKIKVPGDPGHHWGGHMNANAHGTREGYSLSNAEHLRRVDSQFQACVAAIKGVTVSPLTPSWIDASSGKGARLDHLVGLGVEFACTSGVAAWVGTPFHDHARVSFAVKLGTPKASIKQADKRAWYQKLTLKQWQGISHQIDDSLKSRAIQSLERLKGGGRCGSRETTDD